MSHICTLLDKSLEHFNYVNNYVNMLYKSHVTVFFSWGLIAPFASMTWTEITSQLRYEINIAFLYLCNKYMK